MRNTQLFHLDSNLFFKSFTWLHPNVPIQFFLLEIYIFNGLEDYRGMDGQEGGRADSGREEGRTDIGLLWIVEDLSILKTFKTF